MDATAATTPIRLRSNRASAGDGRDIVINGLRANTRYFYRVRYRLPGETDWAERAERSFRTARSPGSGFTFTVLSDSHLEHLGGANAAERYRQATLNVAADAPDLHFDLGDAFILHDARTQGQVDESYLTQREYMGNFAHSTPVMLAIGNHEEEEGWNFDDSPSVARMSVRARKEFYPTPGNDGFFSGNTHRLSGIGGDGLREDYYAFEWGDALFVVLDPFHYTMRKPYGTIAGEGGDDPWVGDQWNWTLGRRQYNWLRNTLEGSDAQFKFVFSHHVTGGQPEVPTSAGTPGYVRGGANAADFFEWGGRNADGSWGFDTPSGGLGRPDPPDDARQRRHGVLPRPRPPVRPRDGRRHRVPGAAFGRFDRQTGSTSTGNPTARRSG